MSSRREIIERISTSLAVLYDPREARSIAIAVISDLSGLTTSQLLTDPNATLEIDGLEAIEEQLRAGRPMQYVLGNAEFCGLTFSVREGVLIPRPETEELVDWVVRSEASASALLDVGTGSGCIAAALKKALPATAVYAADISDEALEIAAENFRQLGVDITLRKADALCELEERFPERFDAIISNPPYIPQSDIESMHTNVVEHEPHTALFVPDDDSLCFYRAIARAGIRILQPQGRIYFEIYEQAADAIVAMVAEEGYTNAEVRRDINNKPRMICCRLK